MVNDKPKQTKDYNRIGVRWARIQAGIAVGGIAATVVVGVYLYKRVDVIADTVNVEGNKVQVQAVTVEINGIGGSIESEQVAEAPEFTETPVPTLEPTPVPTLEPTPAITPESQEDPTITIIGGTLGPTRRSEVESGEPCLTTSENCRYVQYRLSDFDYGMYEFTCRHDGWNYSQPDDFGKTYLITVDDGTTNPQELGCFLNFDLLTGRGGVIVEARGPRTVSEDGSVTYRGSVFSNWTKEVIDISAE
ncbi:MAG: hypothetical protein OXH53_01685 [bacterium]|nr:hypothetical protein [bacterium]